MQLGWETVTARGRNLIALAICDNLLTYTDSLVNTLCKCTTCGRCESEDICGPKVKNVAIVEALRADIIKKGKGLKRHLYFGESIRKERNPYRELHTNRFLWSSKDFPKNRNIVYFVGCTAAYRSQKIAQDTVKILCKAKVDFGLLYEDEWCCGSPLIRTGQRELAEDMAKHNVHVLKEHGAKKVVTSCAGCYRTLKEDYSEQFGLNPDFEVLHITELLAKLLEKGAINFARGIERKVTYHDPCHLGRHGGLYDAPRKVLQHIPGISLIEMEDSREKARCCGAGGGLKSAFPDLAVAVARLRLRDSINIGADVITSACPFCYINLHDALQKTGLRLEMYDVVELIAASIR